MSLRQLPESENRDAAALPVFKKRVEWVDASRALAMFFIMWLHTNAAPQWIAPLVEGGLVLFFVFAGYFLPRSPKKCLLRTLRLLLALCLWMFFSSIFIMRIMPNIDYTWQDMIGWGVVPLNYPLWFLKDLIIFQFIMYVLMCLRILPRYAWILLVILASFSYTNEYGPAGPVSFSWMIPLLLGYALSDFSIIRITEYIRDNIVLLFFAAFFILIQPYIIGMLAPYFDLSSYRPKLAITAFAYAMLFAVFMLFLEKRCSRLLSFMAFLGSYTMFIYASHYLLYLIMNYVCVIYFGSEQIDGFWMPFAAFLILVPLCRFLQHFFPRMMTLLACPPPRK